MAKLSHSFKIPLTKNGSLLRYVHQCGDETYWDENTKQYEKVRWHDNFTFEATLKFKQFARGRSAAYAILEEHNYRWGKGYEGERIFYIFLKDLEDILTDRIDNCFLKAKIRGQWVFVKRGANYGIALLE